MKKRLSVSCLFLFIFQFALTAFAQEKVITEQEFFTLGNKADEIQENSSYRRKITSKSFLDKNNSNPDSVSTEIYEKTSDAHHVISEIKSKDGTSRTEEIKIGERKFFRRNDESWKEIPAENKQMRREGILTKGIEEESSFEYKYLGEVKIGKQKADLYEMKGFVKYKSPDSERTNLILERTWFDKLGRKLKVERLREINGKVIPFVIFEYEYDPNIKIEAPIK